MVLHASPSMRSMVSATTTLPPEEAIAETGHALGEKSIGTFLSFIFVINQIYGPGVLAIPLVYAQSGLFPVMFMVTFFLVVSSLAATCLAQAIAAIPGNRQFTQRIEFGTAVEHYYGHRWHIAFQVCLTITVQAYNIASVVICAQSLDQAFISLAGHTWAFEWGPSIGFHAYDVVDDLYSSNHVTITLGYMIIMLFFLPAGFMNLNDNVSTVQVASFVFLIVLMGEFVGFFLWQGVQEGYHSLPVFGDTYTQLVSVFIFSWAYVIFVPSWLNEKAVGTSVNKVIWSAGIASWIGYIAIGWLCASVFSGSAIGLDNMLVSLSRVDVPLVTRITSHLFSLGVIAPGIPVCSVTTRYNLYVGGICGKKQSYFWGCVAPWIVGFIFCQGVIFANLLNWTSLIFNGLVNFLVPFVMYLTSVRRAQKEAAAEPPMRLTDDSLAQLNASYSPVNPAYLGSIVTLNAPLLTGSVKEGHEGESECVESVHSLNYVPLGGGGVQDADCEAGNARKRLYSHAFDPTDLHGPVYPLPKSMRPHAYAIVLGVLIVTQLLITVQTAGLLYYAAKGQDVLGNSS